MFRLGDIYTHIEQALFCCDCVELSGKIHVIFSHKMTRAAGYAQYASKRITLGAAYWVIAPEKDKINTIYHEVCHIIANYKYGCVKSHGHKWRYLMLICGQNPTRCHNVDTGIPRRRRKQRLATCGCPNGCLIGPTQYKWLKTGKKGYKCVKCGKRVTIGVNT